MRCTILVPQEGVGAVMGLCQERRGVFVTMEPIEQRLQIVYDLPLAEIVLDFYDQLKSRDARLRLARLRDRRLPREPAGEARRAARRRHGGRALDDRPPRPRLRARQGPGRAAAQDDPAPALRRARAGRHRRQDPRPRDREGQAQGRARQVLRRRHQPQAQAARAPEGGQEAHEAGGLGRGAPGGVPLGAAHRRRRAQRWTATDERVRHLYLHLPFCASRCGYCAFVVETGSLAMRDAYADALLAELRREAGLLGRLETVYLGGGTPTLMRPRRIARLLDALAPAPGRRRRGEHRGQPRDGGPPGAARAAGDGRDTAVGGGAVVPTAPRWPPSTAQATPDQARDVVGCARAAGFENISIDLIFGVPGQTPADLEADLADALALAPEHVSWYELELKPGSALARRGLPALDEDEGADAYRRIVAGLEEAGYRWYETANYARPGRECRHSLAYWSAADYLGLGIGAVSTVGGRRWRNRPGPGRLRRRAVPGRRPAAHRPTRSTATTCAASAGCSGCAWPRGSTRPGPARPTAPTPCAAWPRRACWRPATAPSRSPARAASCRTRSSTS